MIGNRLNLNSSAGYAGSPLPLNWPTLILNMISQKDKKNKNKKSKQRKKQIWFQLAGCPPILPSPRLALATSPAGQSPDTSANEKQTFPFKPRSRPTGVTKLSLTSIPTGTLFCFQSPQHLDSIPKS